MQPSTIFTTAAPTETQEDKERFVKDGIWYTCVIV